MSKLKKIRRFIIPLMALTALSTILAVFLSYYLIPLAGTHPFFSRLKIFKKSNEKVTVVNKTEKVVISEEKSLESIATPSARSIVNLVSSPKNIPVNSLEKSITVPKNGTGVILTGDGIIAASRKSILEIDSDYFVLFYDGSQKEAQLLGIDPFTNLAFFQVEVSNLPAVPFNEESTCFPGEKIIIVKNDGKTYANSYIERVKKQFDETLNLSGKTVSSSEKMEGFCRIVPANQDAVSGIVLNYKGEFIGISDGYQLEEAFNGYLVGASEVKQVMDLAADNQLEARPQLGVYYLSLNKSLVLANQLEVENGALIYSPSGQQGLAILTGSAADKADIRVGDIITAVGETAVDSLNPLANLIANYSQGDQVEITILRNNSEIKTEIILQ